MITRAHIIRWTAVLLWMVLIFGFSAQSSYKSGKTSHKVTNAVKAVVTVVAPKAAKKIDFDSFDEITRSCAHFSIYLVLGFLTSWALKLNFTGYRLIFASLIICILYSISDEIHQIFVPGRAFQFFDLALDTAGSFIAVLLFVNFSYIFAKKG